jgi:phage head maturation protease
LALVTYLEIQRRRVYPGKFPGGASSLTNTMPNARDYLELPMQHRAVDVSTVDTESRQIFFSFSSDTPCRRKFGWEILGHKPNFPNALRTERLDRQAVSLLVEHDWQKVAGTIVNYQLGIGTNYATAKLFTTPVGTNLLQEVKEGRSSVSCGYLIHSMELTRETPGQDNVYTVVAFEVIELSFVACPADPTVGVNRGLDAQLYQCRVLGDQAETRATDVTYSFPTHSEPEPMSSTVQPLTELPDPDTHFSPWKTRSDLTVRMQNIVRERYSLRNILLKGNEVDGVERDVHRCLAREKGLDSMGVLVPFEVFTRDLSITGGAGAGGEMVGSVLQPTILDVIRPYSAVVKAGAQVIDNLVGNFVFPRQATYVPASWETSENVIDTPTGPTFQQLTLSPCRLTVETRVSKQLLEQSADRSLDAFLKATFLRDIGATLDLAALRGPGPGTGTSGQPLGLLAQAENTGTPPYDMSKLAPGVAFGSGLATWTTVLQMRYNVEQSDVIDDGTMAYIISPLAKKALSQDQIIPGSNFPKFIYDETTNKIAGYPAIVTSNLDSTSNQMVFGRFSDYVFTLWALDVFSDPFTYAGAHLVRIVINALVNCGTLRGISFCRSEDSAAH